MKEAIDKLREQRTEASRSIPRLQQEVRSATQSLEEKQKLLTAAEALVQACDDAVVVLDAEESTRVQAKSTSVSPP